MPFTLEKTYVQKVCEASHSVYTWKFLMGGRASLIKKLILSEIVASKTAPELKYTILINALHRLLYLYSKVRLGEPKHSG